MIELTFPQFSHLIAGEIGSQSEKQDSGVSSSAQITHESELVASSRTFYNPQEVVLIMSPNRGSTERTRGKMLRISK